MTTRIGTHVTVDVDKLSEGNRAYWLAYGGDLAGVVTGVVTGRAGQVYAVTFSNGSGGRFDADALKPAAEQGVLFA